MSESAVSAIHAALPSVPIEENVPLRHFTTLMAGGNARWFINAKNVDILAASSAIAQEHKAKHLILGSGSNMLVADSGYSGLVILNSAKKKYFGKTQYAETGAWLQDVFLASAQKGLTGMEFAVGIPGTLGGALVSNAGAYRSNISALLSEIEIVHEGVRAWVEPNYLDFNYRDSILRRPNPPAITLLSVKMNMQSGDPKEIYDNARDYQFQRIHKQPPHASAGSFFKNVISQELAQDLPGLTPGMRSAGVIPAGFLIEACSMKGFAIGGAKISQKHANFICNMGDASASDIYAVAQTAKKAVYEKFGVHLEEEVLYLGDWQ